VAINISPGVYTKELDFSVYAPRLASTIFGIVTTAAKGPLNELTLITDEAQLVDTFGPPGPLHYGMYAAIQYLRQGRILLVVRVATYDQTAVGYLRNGANDQNAAKLDPTSSGSWGNDLTVTVQDTLGEGYRLTVKFRGVQVEVYDGVLIGSANQNRQTYIETQINGVSQYLTVQDLNGADETLKVGTFGLSGGDDGAPADDSDVVGTQIGNTRTGLQLFEDPEKVDVNLIAVPGRWERNIVTSLLTIVEQRQDCLALIDPPYGLSVQQVVDWHNGQLTGDPDYLTAAINTSYAALYYPWLQFYDGYSDSEVWVPPSGVAARIMAYNDSVQDPWWAPAGLRRGRVVDALDIEYSPTLGERDYMYGRAGQNVNPFVNFTVDGITLWGQKTLSRLPTSLDRINVRRMLLYARKVIATSCRYLVFEPNDAITWSQFRGLVAPVLAYIQSRRGIFDFRVICDETTNPPYKIDQNVMTGKLLIKPTKTAEIIEIEFTLLPTGANFEEF
jgi:phage tail sheath protein FI